MAKQAVNKKRKYPKVDPHRVSNQPWELDYIIDRMGKEGIKVSRDDVRKAKKQSVMRIKIYAILRSASY